MRIRLRFRILLTQLRRKVGALLFQLHGFLKTRSWGSVADWTMTIVTLITVYFLNKTLISQIDVQRDQHNLVELEHARESRAIKPQIYFEFLSSGRDSNYIYYNYRLVCKRNIAEEICFEIMTLPVSGSYPVFFQPNTLLPQLEEGIFTNFYIRYPADIGHKLISDTASFYKNPQAYQNSHPLEFEIPAVDFIMYYKDAQGTAYQKFVALDRARAVNRSVTKSYKHPHSTVHWANLKRFNYVYGSGMKPELEFALTNDGH